MKVSKFKLGATIPTQQYGNITPEIELEDVDLSEATEATLAHISSLYDRFSERGGLKDNGARELVINKSIKKNSFNEEGVVIDYDDDAHTYHFEGERLVSGSAIAAKYYKKFDSENVSKASANKWGVDQQDVKGLWSANGKLAADFGSVIHLALEHYDLYKNLGAKISENRGEEDNYALPKHPILRSIIEEFEKINTTVGEEVVPEALVTNVKKGYCGHADRVLIINKKKKICRVQDYKVNIGSEDESSSMKAKKPFDELPKNKITKYQIQMSAYANMLQDSGWTVEGLDVFVLEDSWKHHELDVLKVI